MDSRNLFVPRPAELAEFENWTTHEPTTGNVKRAALVVGPAGMGKSTLLGMFENLCTTHAPATWFCQRVVLNSNESASSFLERLLSDIHKLMRGEYLRTGPNDERIKKELIKLVPKAGDLLAILVKEDKRPGWERFVDYLAAISAALEKQDGRFILLIDPDRAMQEGQVEDWHSIAKRLPPRTRILLAQRPDDVIAADRESKLAFARIPESGSLRELDEAGTLKLYDNEFNFGRLRPLTTNWPTDVRDTLPRVAYKRYAGHPFAHDAVIRLLEAKTDIADPAAAIAEWPRDVEDLMDMLYASLAGHGEDAVRAALALQVFAMPAPFDKWAEASGLGDLKLSGLLANPRYQHFFEKSEPDHWKPFHQLFAERLERELNRLNQTRVDLVNAAWKAIESHLDRDSMEAGVPNEFALLAATNVVSRLPTTPALLNDINRLAITKIRLGFLDSAERDFNQLLCLLGEPIGEGHASVHLNLGNLLFMRGDEKGAEQSYNIALEVNRRLSRVEGIAKCLGSLGILMGHRGNHEGAERSFREVIELELSRGELENVANAYGNIGSIHLRCRNPSRAEPSIRIALRLFQKLKNELGIAIQLGNLGTVYCMRFDPENAAKHYIQSSEINSRIGNTLGLANNFGNIGHLARSRGDYAKARSAWVLSRDLFRKLGNETKAKYTDRLIGNLPK